MAKLMVRAGSYGATAGAVALLAGALNGNGGLAVAGAVLLVASVLALALWYRKRPRDLGDL